MIQRFDVNPVMTRVAVLPYSFYYKPANYFKSGVNAKYVDKVVDKLIYEGSFTRLISALKVTQYDLFSKDNGARWRTKGLQISMSLCL